MENIRKQVQKMGYPVNGKLRRCPDDTETQCRRRYTDAEGTVYAIDQTGKLAYIAGDTWVI